MRRGTTSTMYIKVNGIEVDKLDRIYLTLKQSNRELTITDEDIFKNAEEERIEAPLTQEQTLMFKDGYVSVQIRAMVGDNAIASDIKTVPIEHILMEGVIG